MEENSLIISIIIPFYNVEQFIAECLYSVYNQDIPEDIYEVICVNDASPDKSRDIVIEYQKIHSNLILIEHESNKKLGPARNTGRSIAKGKYIWNIDSDDKIQPNVLSKIINVCESNSLDVLIFNFDHLSNNNQILNAAYPFVNSEVLNGIDFIKKYCIGNFGEISPIWTQIYKKEFLDENNIFSPPINMGEDVPFTLKSLLFAKRIKSITDCCYVYRANELSLGGEIEIIPSAEKLYEKCFICSKHVFETIRFIPKNEPLIKNEYLAITKYIISLFPGYINRMSYLEYLKFKSACRKNVFQNLNLIKLLSNKNKILYFNKVLFNFSQK